MVKNRIYTWIAAILLGIALIPLLLNWILQKDVLFPVVGDSVIWLSFWPEYLSAIASFGVICLTYYTLQQNKKQLDEMKRQKEEDERARLVFSVIVYQYAFYLKISNIGKRDVYEATIHFNENFLNELLQEKIEEGYRQLAKPFFVEAGTSRYLYIGWCQDVNDAWKSKNVVIRMKGSYNGCYNIDEEIDMNLFIDKTFMVVKGELETTVGHIKKGLVVQNDSYMPIQKSLDVIAKSIRNIETSLNSTYECLRDFQRNGEDNLVKNNGDM